MVGRYSFMWIGTNYKHGVFAAFHPNVHGGFVCSCEVNITFDDGTYFLWMVSSAKNYRVRGFKTNIRSVFLSVILTNDEGPGHRNAIWYMAWNILPALALPKRLFNQESRWPTVVMRLRLAFRKQGVPLYATAAPLRPSKMNLDENLWMSWTAYYLAFFNFYFEPFDFE